jgi:hypothetical protein
VSTFQKLMTRLNQPESASTNADGFFKKDLFCSPRYREDEAERRTMEIRYDERAAVVSRSICGKISNYQEYRKNMTT